jgi:hypothetical protein
MMDITYNGDRQRKEVPQEDETRIDEQFLDDVSICQTHREDIISGGLDISYPSIQLPPLFPPSASLTSLFRCETGFFIIVELIVRARKIHLHTLCDRRQIGDVCVIGRQRFLFVALVVDRLANGFGMILPLLGRGGQR